MATSRRVGNYSTSAKAVVGASDQIFDAAMSGKPDFTKISQEAIKARSLERRAVTEAEADVASAGLDAFTDTNLTKMREDTKKDVRDIMRPAKRMAGVVAGLGALTTGYVTMENNKRDKAERDAFRSEQDALYQKQSEMMAGYKAQSEALMQQLASSIGSGSSNSTPPSSSGTTPPSSTTKPISSGDALDAGSGNAGSGKVYTQQQITQFAQQAGFNPENAKIMGAIAMGESRGNSGIDTVQSGLDPGKKNEYSIGLTQINVKAHRDKLTRRGWTEEDLRDPVKNMTIAKEVYDEVGSFKPWSVYTSGKYTSYLK